MMDKSYAYVNAEFCVHFPTFAFLFISQIMGVIDVKHTEHELIIEWESSAINDMIADSALAVVVGADHSQASVQRERFS